MLGSGCSLRRATFTKPTGSNQDGSGHHKADDSILELSSIFPYHPHVSFPLMLRGVDKELANAYVEAIDTKVLRKDGISVSDVTSQNIA